MKHTTLRLRTKGAVGLISLLIILAVLGFAVIYYAHSYAKHETFTKTQTPGSNYMDDINAAQNAKIQAEQESRLK